MVVALSFSVFGEGPRRTGPQFEDAWRRLDEGMMMVEVSKEAWPHPEILRFAGEIALMSPERDAAKAQGYFERALTVAHHQQAKSWELRSAMSLARLWRDQGKVQQAPETRAISWRRRRCLTSWRREGAACTISDHLAKCSPTASRTCRQWTSECTMFAPSWTQSASNARGSLEFQKADRSPRFLPQAPTLKPTL